MAKIKLLIDTDIIIDLLKGIKTSKDLFRSNKFDFYCSIQSKKELLSKIGLKDSERKRIATVLSKIKVLKIEALAKVSNCHPEPFGLCHPELVEG